MRKIQVKITLLVMALCFSVFPAVTLGSTSTTIKINNKPLSHASFSQNGVTYVPLNEIAQKMGDKVTTAPANQGVSIKLKNGKVVTVKANQVNAVYGGEAVPLKTKKLNGVIVPVSAKAIYKNGQVFVPIEFLSAVKGMNYVVQSNGKTIVVSKKTATPTKPASTQTKPGTSTGKVYPDGWVAPVLKSKWSPDPEVNYKTLQNELGFTDDGAIYAIPEDPRGAIHVVSNGGTEVSLTFYYWQTKSYKNSYRIPIVTKELFKLYFEEDANKVWNYFNRGDVPENFTANGHKVKAMAGPVGDLSLHFK